MPTYHRAMEKGGNFSIVIMIFVISIIITTGSVESVVADSVKFDQKYAIIDGMTDIISFIDNDSSETNNFVTVQLFSPTSGTKDFQLYKVSGTPAGTPQIFRTLVNFTTKTTGIEPIFRVGLGETATLSFDQNTDQVIMKPKSDVTPSPPYMNNKFTTTAASCGTDIDSDGICDNWEQDGVLTVSNVPGITGSYSPPSDSLMQIEGPSAALGHKDIYLEIDWMQGHRPNEEAIWDVINGFKNNMGIYLHVQLDDENTSADSAIIPYTACTKWPGSNLPAASRGFDQIAGSYFGTLAERGDPRTNWDNNIWKLKHQVFHHALFAHKQCGTTSSGVAEVGGDEFMVTLGTLNDIYEPISPDQIAGTLMHELGHNLNLNHGGNFNDAKNCKPTHMSVMSYSRQWSDLVSDRNLEYSRQAVDLVNSLAINENSINEGIGIQLYAPDPAERIVWGNPTPPLNLPTTGTNSVDWNKNTVIDPIPLPNYNINSINTINGKVVCQEPTIQQLPGFWDTNALVFNIRSDGDWADGRPAAAGVELAPVLEDPELTEMDNWMESPFCIPPEIILETLLSEVPSASIEDQLDHFNNTRSCAGGRGETDVDVIRQAYQNATMPTGASVSDLGISDYIPTIPSDDDELTPDDAISMRLSRIDSIMAYLQDNTIEKDFINGDQNENLKFYQGETDAIKKNIADHRLFDVLMQLKKLVDSYSNHVKNNDKLKDLKHGTADIYDSINKAALGPPMVIGSSPPISVVSGGKINPVLIPELMILHPDLFEKGVIKTDYMPFIKNGNLLVSEWKIAKEGKEVRDDPTYLKPNKMLKFVDKIELVCNEGLVKLDKPDSKSVVCVKESTKKVLDPIWHPSKTTMN